MLDVLPPHTSQENSQTAMHTWKSVALVIFDTLFTLQPNTSATGILFFTEYLTKKQAEGKHYNVALSHATKKLVRLIYALQKSGKAYLAVT